MADSSTVTPAAEALLRDLVDVFIVLGPTHVRAATASYDASVVEAAQRALLALAGAMGGLPHDRRPSLKSCLSIVSEDHSEGETETTGQGGPLYIDDDCCNPLSQNFHRGNSMTRSVAGASVASIALPQVALTATAFRRESDGVKKLNQYEIVDTIGRGQEGKVKLAYDTDRKTLVAIKVLRRTVANSSQLDREVEVMQKLRHKNLVALFEVIHDDHTRKMYLVMQYVDDGNVFQLRDDGTCDPLEERDAADVARQLCAGLEYLHRHRIVHRDIKPDNILKMRDGRVYLADFGLSEALREVEGYRGTPLFMAPELIASHSSIDGFAADVWSLGVTLYAMVVGRLPFTLVEDIGKIELNYPETLSPAWKSLLRSMLRRNPAERIRISVIRATLKRLPAEDSTPNSSAPNSTSDDDVAISPRSHRRLFNLVAKAAGHIYTTDDIEDRTLNSPPSTL